MSKIVAIIGDHFMLPKLFEEKLKTVCGSTLQIRCTQNDWPNTPMQQSAEATMDGVKEYFGTAADVVKFVTDAEILVTHLAPMSRSMFEQLPNLKMIAVSRGGPVNIDMQAAGEHGVLVVNTPGRNATAVAEFTIGAILVETRKIRHGHEALRGGNWRGDLYRADITGRELNEMTVGVIGFGKIGRRVVRLLTAFGSKVLVHDPYVQMTQVDIDAGVSMVSLENLLSASDVVTLHSRVNNETRNMMNGEKFSLMKKGALFVNTARGDLCDYDALYYALTQGHLGGAMLETFAIEPCPSDYPLLQLTNVTLTPHIAGASLHTIIYASEQVAEEVRRFIAGEPAKNPC